ncbi:MAG: hypothetical protein J0L63_01385 [Anaerolineae bacterium]|nr:hypothetical protein [Anaerolineae bacterium]MBN8617524.1 hypothetical protein [Anaerolineae bacterium]
MLTKGSRGPWGWPLLLTAIGIIFLLHNFLLLGDFNALSLWPLLLVIAGVVILVRGDFIPAAETRTFGITRGSVESATLEISSGEIDVQIRGLQQEGRLIAGQFAMSARPSMRVSETYTHLKMDRSATPWLSFADWEVGLARDLPWQLLVSSYLGQINLNLADLIVQDSSIATGIGDIRLIAPIEAFGQVQVRSAVGNIHIVTPVGYRTQIVIQKGRLLGVHADERRYVQESASVYSSIDPDDSAPLVEIQVTGSYGDVYLS